MAVLWSIMFSSFCTNGCLHDERFAHLSRIAQPIAVKAMFKPMSVKTLYLFSLFNWHSQDCSGYLITAQRWRRGSSRKAKDKLCLKQFLEEAGQLLDMIIPKKITTPVKNFRGTFVMQQMWYRKNYHSSCSNFRIYRKLQVRSALDAFWVKFPNYSKMENLKMCLLFFPKA